MEVSMEDAVPPQQQQQQHGLQAQQELWHSHQQLQQPDCLRERLPDLQPNPSGLAQDMSATLVQQVTDHDSQQWHQQQAPQHIQPQQEQQQQNTQQQQQQQQQQDGKQRCGKGSRYTDEKDEGPNVDNWWLSESEGEDDDDEQRLLKSEDGLYDPQADEADEAWAVQQRSGRTTDAILSCPGCFTTLCIDCQQHEHYHTQYRAMFTQNCEVKMDEVLQAQQQQQQQHGRKRKAGAAMPQGLGVEEGVVLHPVCCAVCGTQVGAQDANEIVHFYSVLASEC